MKTITCLGAVSALAVTVIGVTAVGAANAATTAVPAPRPAVSVPAAQPIDFQPNQAQTLQAAGAGAGTGALVGAGVGCVFMGGTFGLAGAVLGAGIGAIPGAIVGCGVGGVLGAPVGALAGAGYAALQSQQQQCDQSHTESPTLCYLQYNPQQYYGNANN